jgi:hypothetical protein
MVFVRCSAFVCWTFFLGLFFLGEKGVFAGFIQAPEWHHFGVHFLAPKRRWIFEGPMFERSFSGPVFGATLWPFF